LTGNAYADRAGEETNLIAHTLRGEGFDASEDGTGRGIPLVAAFLGGQSSQARSLAYSESVFPTLKAASSGTNQVPSIVAVVNGNSTPEVSMDIAMPLRANDGSGNRQAILAFDTTQITSPQSRSHPKPGDPCHPLAAAAHAPAIAFQPKASVTQSMSIGETCPTIGTTKEPGVYTRMAIRRLTPTECERLQNFPDNFTLVPYRRKLAKDGPRYRAIGNSMCTSVMSWIGKRIQLVEEIRNAKESCSTEC
jgi:DNA (cytosine-5)-methyltransferase 1